MKEILVEHFTKDYGSGRGVFDISFEINKGEVFGFLGPNGAGKSTTIRHLMGFSNPDSGKTQILGIDSFGHYDKFMQHVGYLPGEVALPAGLTGYEFIEMMKKLKNANNDEWLKHLMEYFELDPSGDTKRMSLGVKRKLAVVTAFMNDPEILILDEPTSGLDLKMQQRFIEFIREEKKRGKTILLSSHIFGEIDSTCDRIAIIKDGIIVSEFIAAELKHSQDKCFRVYFEKETDKENFIKDCKKSKNFSVEFTKEENHVTVFTSDSSINELIKVLAKYKTSNIEELKETLEEYFMKYYNRENKEFGGVL